MIKKYFLPFLSVYLIFSTTLTSQEKGGFDVKFSGYINWTAILDTRQTVNAREGHFLLFPKEELLDPQGKDINNSGNFNMAVIQSRLAAKINAPAFLEAKTSGLIEAEFMGNSDNDINGLRIRHAYIMFNWGNTNLLLGQYWNPMFIPESFPEQIGSNGGAPFQPFARNPQIRFTAQLTDNFRFIAAFLSERDFTSFGPNGGSSEYLRNSSLPIADVQVMVNTGNLTFGTGGEYKTLRPTLKTKNNSVNDNTVKSSTLMAFTKMVFGQLKLKLQSVYGGNLADMTMLGGYGVSSIDSVTYKENYTPINTFSLWTDISYGSALEFGIFSGYTENLGADEIIKGNYYSRGSNIDRVYRIAPRFCYSEGKTKLSCELEYTAAAYGKTDLKGRVNDSKLIANYRFYTSIYYYF